MYIYIYSPEHRSAVQANATTVLTAYYCSCYHTQFSPYGGRSTGWETENWVCGVRTGTDLRPQSSYWVWAPPGALSPEINQLGREGDRSLAFSACVKKPWSHVSTPLYVFMVCCLSKHRDNCYYCLVLIHTVSRCCMWQRCGASGKGQDGQTAELSIRSLAFRFCELWP